jgi:uncharacterized membrane protein
VSRFRETRGEPAAVDFCLFERASRHLTGMKPILIATLILAFAACSSSEEEELPPVVDCSAVQPIPKYSEVLAFRDVCTNCHSSSKTGDDRNGAPAEINFDQFASASSHAEQAAIEVNNDAMPPDTSGLSLTEVQKTTLYDWAMCGAPQ